MLSIVNPAFIRSAASLNEINAGSYIVWWEGDRYSLHNFNTFKNNFELMEVKRMKEGVIYRITLNRVNGYF